MLGQGVWKAARLGSLGLGVAVQIVDSGSSGRLRRHVEISGLRALFERVSGSRTPAQRAF